MPDTISNIEHLEAAASAINDLSAQDVALTQFRLKIYPYGPNILWQ